MFEQILDFNINEENTYSETLKKLGEYASQYDDFLNEVVDYNDDEISDESWMIY